MKDMKKIYFFWKPSRDALRDKNPGIRRKLMKKIAGRSATVRLFMSFMSKALGTNTFHSVQLIS
jgi:hypothetical protein